MGPESTAPSSATRTLSPLLPDIPGCPGRSRHGAQSPPGPAGTGQGPRWPPGGTFPSIPGLPHLHPPWSQLFPAGSWTGPHPAPGVGHGSLSSGSGPPSVPQHLAQSPVRAPAWGVGVGLGQPPPSACPGDTELSPQSRRLAPDLGPLAFCSQGRRSPCHPPWVPILPSALCPLPPAYCLP